MKSLNIDLERACVTVRTGAGEVTHALASPEAFEALSDAWLRCGWDVKHVYSFTWLGRPVIQLPEDLVRLQEVVYRVRPDVVVETGVAHGGSLVFFASLFQALGHGRVIGVELELRAHNRAALEEHELFHRIALVDGSSTAPETVAQVRALVAPGERALVVLDSCHEKAHVLAELEAYADLVPVGSYLVACDGIMGRLGDAPRSSGDWSWNNPEAAAAEFVAGRDDFVLETPPFAFNEGAVRRPVTYWPGAWVKRVRPAGG